MQVSCPKQILKEGSGANLFNKFTIIKRHLAESYRVNRGEMILLNYIVIHSFIS